MYFGNKKNIILFLGKVTLITLLIAFVIRTFFIETYSVSSSQMQTALLHGDVVSVDKTAYGIRMPITPLCIPFAFDSILGIKSYSSALELSYTRLLESKPLRNDVLLFNNPVDISKPVDRRSLITSRCIALPGDTIAVRQDVYLINGRPYVISPDFMEEYLYLANYELLIKDAFSEYDIPFRNRKQNSDTISVYLNKYESLLVNQSLPDSLALVHHETIHLDYTFVIPQRAAIIDLTPQYVAIYGKAILGENNQQGFIKDGKLYVDGNELTSYEFKDDYYWVLSDNPANSIDSRSIGFVPFSHIIGRVNYILYSWDKDGLRTERCFSSLK